MVSAVLPRDTRLYLQTRHNSPERPASIPTYGLLQVTSRSGVAPQVAFLVQTRGCWTKHVIAAYWDASCWLITFIYLYICFFLKRGAWQTLRCKERKYDKLKRVCGKQLASFLGATNRTSVLQRSKLHLIVYHLFQSHELKLPWDFPWTKMLAAISNY